MAWNAPNFIALASTLALLATVSVALRIWAHTKSNNRFGLDDILIAPALVGDTSRSFESRLTRSIVVRSRYGDHYDSRSVESSSRIPCADMAPGTEYGAMAQHQTNEMGPHGPVYTKQLAAYEKVRLCFVHR
jgi:hypothetical protein